MTLYEVAPFLGKNVEVNYYSIIEHRREKVEGFIFNIDTTYDVNRIHLVGPDNAIESITLNSIEVITCRRG